MQTISKLLSGLQEAAFLLDCQIYAGGIVTESMIPLLASTCPALRALDCWDVVIIPETSQEILRDVLCFVYTGR